MTQLEIARMGKVSPEMEEATVHGHRRDLNWDGMISEAIDPDWARQRVSLSTNGETCTMCGELCAVKLSRGSAKRAKSI